MGKVAKFFADFLDYNVSTHSTEYGAIQQIAFDPGVKLPARGLGTSEGYKRTFEAIKKYDRILLILDEVKKLKDLTNIVLCIYSR